MVGHVLQEESRAMGAMHLEYWYGSVRGSDLDDEDFDNPVVCWCGGRRYCMDASHYVVLHVGTWTGFAGMLDSGVEDDDED